ncbi:MAG: hypothetical protein KKD59_10955, partial [Acidobacteria bacterium]|nr:hypothetical protein [Acidobacteriota bacterium]
QEEKFDSVDMRAYNKYIIHLEGKTMRVESRTFRLIFSCLVLLFFVVLAGSSGGAVRIGQEDRLLAYESDLYCSYFIWEGAFPELKIVDWEKNSDRKLLTLGDVIYLNKGETDGLLLNQAFEVIEIGPGIGRYGRLAYRRGRVKIEALKGGRAAAVIESACGPIRLGQFLVPFVEKAAVSGEDLGFDDQIEEEDEPKGRFLYLQDGYVQAGTGHWAIINLGREDGVDIGEQLLACRKSGKDAFLTAFANCVVLDVGTRTATVKIISSRDAVTLKDWIVPRTKNRSGR